ncbi:MAG TPA: cytidine deaminase [Chryseolinea sp.]
MNDYTILKNLNDLDSESKALLEKAKEALPNAYAPYSNFHVAAAILLSDGSVVTGTNQENAAYPSGMCAERVALFTVSAQHPGKTIKKIVVLARLANGTEFAPATSCGACRQVMLEYEQRQGKPFEVIMQNQDRHWVKTTSAETLLPFCFSNESLQVRK